MDLENILVKRVKDKYYHLYVESKKTLLINLYTRQNQTDIENKHDYQRGRWGNIRSMGLTDINTVYKIDNQQGFTIQHRQRSLAGYSPWGSQKTWTQLYMHALAGN